MPEQSELTATFIRERNVFENDDGSRVVIASVNPSKPCDRGNRDFGGEVTVKGDWPAGELKPNLEYRFWGHWLQHYRHGWQFIASTQVAEEPVTADAIIAYLTEMGKGLGVGRRTAEHLWTKYHEKAVEFVRENPDGDYKDIPRFTAEKCRELSERLKVNHKIERAKIDLIGLLGGRGFPKKTIQLALTQWGSAAAWVIRRSPYRLMRFKGCGFLGTDKMFLDLGGNPAKLKRQALCAWYAVSNSSEGHTWFSYGTATGAITSSIAASEVKADKAMRMCRIAGYLTARTENGVTYVAESRKATQESNLAELISKAKKGKPDAWPITSEILGIESLSEHQKDTLNSALRGPIAILGGRPGTGKTYTAAALIKYLAAKHGAANILACAPTGKAAVRLTEALESYGVSIEATTGHRMLGVRSASDGGFEFEYGLNNPLEAKYVILDEQSMSDTGMMLSLLSARAANTCYLLIGDINQLAPVGHGAPLRDMIAAGVPYGELTEIRRNSGRIVMACRDIVEQGQADVPAKFDFDNGENMAILSATNPSIQINAMENFIKRCGEDGRDPVWDIQVITAVNEKSTLSRKTLNLRLQAVLNPTGEGRKGHPFRVGDKVICLKNSWFPVHNQGRGSDERALVCNGELGEVLAIEPMRTIVRLQSPDRTIMIPQGQAKADSGSVGYWDLGYAISCHKSQGSEFPIVVVMLDEYGGARRISTKNWIYTGVSRGKEMTLLIGQKWLFDEMCKKPGLNRSTFLTEQILDSVAVNTADQHDAIEGIF